LFGVIACFQLDTFFAQETSCLATGVSGGFEEEFDWHGCIPCANLSGLVD
jgi:hypothetical protein